MRRTRPVQVCVAAAVLMVALAAAGTAQPPNKKAGPADKAPTPRPALDILQPSSSPRVVFTAAVQPRLARATNFVNFRAGTMSLWFIAGEETAR